MATDLPSPREANQAGFNAAGAVWSTGGYGAGQVYTNEHVHFNPDAQDNDGDGVGQACDCDDGNPAVWATPGEVQNLILSKSANPTESVLSWDAAQDPGGTTLAYDTLRSAAADFVSAAVCVESGDGADLTSTDDSIPPPGAAYFFLVRAVNDCPGLQRAGSLGAATDGTPRVGRSCP